MVRGLVQWFGLVNNPEQRTLNQTPNREPRTPNRTSIES